ncbi:unnamed protein product [Clonostachys solani]|uniref:Uncharacterized protein n=1 Tax=Clonostachys solani TaxID=160281 RepID=A0A9P0EJ93_9HYPO|nr:unnamed protein product [Clonostachys solani]
MDGLGVLAQQVLGAYSGFQDKPSLTPHATFEISVFAKSYHAAGVESAKRDIVQREVLEADVEAWATTDLTDATGAVAEASLRLICVDRGRDNTMSMSKAAFTSLTTAAGVNPAALYMVCGQYDGFHSFNSPGSLQTWFFGTSSHAVLWTFLPSHRRTVGMFMHRRRSLFQDFCQVLSVFAHAIHAPHVMLLSGCVQQQHYFDRETASELSTIHMIEKRTGFGPRSAVAGSAASRPTGSTIRAEIDELTAWSQAIGEVGGKVTNKFRHQRTSERMLGALKEGFQCSGAAGLPPGRAMDMYRASLDELCGVLPTIEQHMHTYEEYLKYLKHRTERLSSVLFILLTHVDARASIGLAVATRRDSSSMKTVAIMTMAFLPGTFFAALFSMPLLQWDGSRIVQDGFWVYLAWTIPVTLLVFGLWIAITKGKSITDMCRRVWET